MKAVTAIHRCTCTCSFCTNMCTPQISKKHVDSYKPHKRIPHCELSAEFKSEVGFSPLCYQVKLLGAKEPYNMFTIKPPLTGMGNTHRSSLGQSSSTKRSSSQALGTCLVLILSLSLYTLLWCIQCLYQRDHGPQTIHHNYLVCTQLVLGACRACLGRAETFIYIVVNTSLSACSRWCVFPLFGCFCPALGSLYISLCIAPTALLSFQLFPWLLLYALVPFFFEVFLPCSGYLEHSNSFLRQYSMLQYINIRDPTWSLREPSMSRNDMPYHSWYTHDRHHPHLNHNIILLVSAIII